MTRRTLFRCSLIVLTFVGVAAPLHAQFRPRSTSNPATGETYHVEFAGGFWSPTPDFVVSSESIGIIGSQINLVSDLGLEKQKFGELHLALRPARKHKFRLQYIPIRYEAATTLTRNIIFNGQSYTVGLPVASSIDWKAWRIGYEYDFFYRDRGFVGLLLEAKYTDVHVELTSILAAEFARARAPIPAIGGIGRVYVAPNISITGELSGFKLPNSIDQDYQGQYVDFDLYGTVNFVDNAGVIVGYRSFDVSYLVKHDSGDLKLDGLYLAGVVRF